MPNKPEPSMDSKIDEILKDYPRLPHEQVELKAQIKQLIADEVAVEKAWQNALKIQIAELESEIEPYRAFKAALQGEPNE